MHIFLQHTFYSKYWHWLHSIMFGSRLVTIAVQMCLIFGCELWPKAPGKIWNWTGKLLEFFSSKRVGTLLRRVNSWGFTCPVYNKSGQATQSIFTFKHVCENRIDVIDYLFLCSLVLFVCRAESLAESEGWRWYTGSSWSPHFGCSWRSSSSVWWIRRFST